MQQILALDLKDDAELIEQYEIEHRRIWPDIAAQLREHGVTDMRIFRLGTRLVMLMETDDRRFDAAAFAASQRDNPIVQQWEARMDRYQTPTPWSQPGTKWTPMTPIFDLAKQ